MVKSYAWKNFHRNPLANSETKEAMLDSESDPKIITFVSGSPTALHAIHRISRMNYSASTIYIYSYRGVFKYSFHIHTQTLRTDRDEKYREKVLDTRPQLLQLSTLGFELMPFQSQYVAQTNSSSRVVLYRICQGGGQYKYLWNIHDQRPLEWYSRHPEV